MEHQMQVDVLKFLKVRDFQWLKGLVRQGSEKEYEGEGQG
jgi:hypothetical protein